MTEVVNWFKRALKETGIGDCHWHNSRLAANSTFSPATLSTTAAA